MSAVEKGESFQVQEHAPYKGPSTRTEPAAFDDDSRDFYNSSWDTAWKATCQLYNTLNHMMAAAVVFYIWIFAMTAEQDGVVSKLHMHIIFAGTGYQLFLLEAIMTLSGHNAWSNVLSKDSKRIVHGCLQVIGGIFVIAGTSMIMAYKTEHFQTGHGICGLIAFVFALISLFTGVFALFSAKVRLLVRFGPVKIVHIAVGILSVVMGLVTLTLGFNKDYFRTISGDGTAIGLIILTTLTIVYVIINPIRNLIKTVTSIYG